MTPIKRQVFFSFEYDADAWRANQVRNMGIVDQSSTFTDNDWEKVKGSELTIKRWINSQLKMRSCLIVLIGETTFTRPWVDYEIQKAYELEKGIVGVYVHKLKDSDGNQSEKGLNPLDFNYTDDGEPLSQYVRTFNSRCVTSVGVYRDIEDNLSDLIEEAIENAGTY
ncbi:MTH538 TIR-like domain [Fibrobacter sp. UWB16]|uniref:TIR domain-containing protein n=1 Tax=unclassified Fibrobacter TaxID=2634177 RepID=UPI000B51E70D|nr:MULTISPECIES: TIR domain-containing protein [unclassified Fibrobacter]OWV20813.1 hypothetical protein B7991_06075 [Fibrobacter sp. UWB3]SOD17422.1 MTH538 TIR-like domain [Fibrobacter sp. UWB16]